MVRYIGLVALFLLLALCGCIPYGYNGYGYGYGSGGYGYPSYGYQGGSSQYGAPYCPQPYGYPYDPYASQYGYGYGSTPGVVVPAPPPPVVVEEPSEVVEDPLYPGDPTVDPAERRRRRRLARERFRNRFPDTATPDDPQNSASGENALTPRERRRMNRQLAREGFRNRTPDGENSSSPQINASRRQFPGNRNNALNQGESRQMGRTWTQGRRSQRFANRDTRSGSQMRPNQVMGSTSGRAQANSRMGQFNPRMGQNMGQRANPRNLGGRAATPQMRQRQPSSSPRPMMAQGRRGAARPQVRQARPQGGRQARPQANRQVRTTMRAAGRTRR